MKRSILFFSALILGISQFNAAAEEALWLRKSCISPDGTKIAFSYQGDIFVVSSNGGKAIQITTNPAYETDPMWTQDGQKIVFSSDRERSRDVFIVSAEGGTPTRLTDYTGSETPLAVLGNGDVLFTANIQMDETYIGYPGEVQLYSVPQEGGKPTRVTSLSISNISINNNGTVLYEDYKGYEDPMRKHHTSSVTRDIWLYTPASGGKKADSAKDGGLTITSDGKFTKLSTFKGENRNPVFAKDGDTYYYISEQSGSFNIWKSSISNPSQSKQITSFDTHPVRYISIAGNGTLAFSYNGELYTVAEGKSPEKVAIEIVKDSNERELEKKTIMSGARAISPSPTGKEVAIVARGDVYVTSVEYNTTKRITDTPEQERDVCFSPDGKTIYYSSERDGNWGIYATTLTEKDDKYFTYATKMEEKLISEPGETCFQPAVSPDGESIAYLRDRTELVVKNLKSGKEKSLLKDVNYSYTDGDQSFEWSPDSQWILTTYMVDGGWNNEDIGLINVDSGEITNLTRSGYSDGSFRWAMGGKAMTWQTDKYGYRSHGSWGAENNILVMFFDGEAYMKFCRDEEGDEIEELLKTEKEAKKEEKEEKKDSAKTDKKAEKLVLDLDNRDDRIVNLTDFSGRMGDYFMTKDGKKLFYVVRSEKSYDLCVLDIKEGEIKTVARKTNGRIEPSQDGKYLYMLTGRGITRIDTGSESTKQISFSGEYEYQPAKEREYIFNHIWKQVAEKFYDPKLHGIDWEGYKEAYSRFLPYITNNYDFTEMLSEMLGELNGSHTGARYRSGTGLSVGNLGVIWDEDYEGDGLKIKEVLKGGVLAVADPEIAEGDIVTEIAGKEVKQGDTWYKHLAGKGGKKIAITVKKGGKKDTELIVTPAYTDYTLLYKRWVRRNEQMVEELSGGRVGYVHVEGMDSDSFREVYSKLLGKYRSYEAVIVDTRHNGGGWLHDDLATLLSGQAYIRWEPRGQYIGTEPYSKWTKPSCVVMGEDNYSDASGFPYVYKALGIGKLIGAPVPGTMTAVWWENQIDPSIVFGIPQVGGIGIKDNRYIENLQIEPDILVYNDPASCLKGEDKQLEAAVEEMLKEIGAK